MEVLEIDFFESVDTRAFVQILTEYKEKYSPTPHPSYDMMASLIKGNIKNFDKSTGERLKKLFISFKDKHVENKEHMISTSIDFCRKQALKKAMMKSVKLIQNSSFDEIEKEIKAALTLGTDNNFGHDYITDAAVRFEVQSRKPVTTGWSELDEITCGGFGVRELAVVIAPTGAGKSMVLVHQGATALELGKTVVHYTLELADTIVGQRYDSCITGVGLKDLIHSKDIVMEKIKDVAGRLIIKEYPTKSASTKTIETHIEKLMKRGINPDVVIVDYADLLRPRSAKSEKRHELENIYEELRAIAQKYECTLLTASQTNRSGLNAEVITMESISEAFNKCFVADFIYSLSRTPQDKQSNKGRIFIAKNRNGPDGLVYNAFVDWSNVKIKVLEESSTGMPEMGSKDALSYLKNKYSNLSGSK
tara:strand:+ start:15 stop:1274 length:1260 start_codon:yes stop_codon:yes gene_type:complete